MQFSIKRYADYKIAQGSREEDVKIVQAHVEDLDSKKILAPGSGTRTWYSGSAGIVTVCSREE